METLVSLLVLAGCLFALLAGVGVIRFPDCYCRLHAATKAGAFGGTILAVAAGVWIGGFATWFQAVLLIVFFYTTMPVGAHLVARASRQCGIEPSAETRTEGIEEFERMAAPPPQADEVDRSPGSGGGE